MLTQILTFPLDARLGGEMNKTFQQLLKEKQSDYADRLFNGRVSSYHDPLENEADWFRYGSLDHQYEVVLAVPEQRDAPRIGKEEMALFASENNCIAVSRDNLFMLWQLWREPLTALLKEPGAKLNIVGFAPINMLPRHENGPLIHPLLVLKRKEAIEVEPAEYDWCFHLEKETDVIGNCVAYLRMKPTKFYT